MILVGVGADDVVDIFDALPCEIGDHKFTVIHVAGVYEHALSAAGYERAVRLSHVQKCHCELFGYSVFFGLGAGGKGEKQY